MKAPDFLDRIEFSNDGDDLLGLCADGCTSEYHYVGAVRLNYEEDCQLARFLSASKQMAAALQCPDLDAAHDALSEVLKEHDPSRSSVIYFAEKLSKALNAHHESRRQALFAAGFTEEVAS